MGGTRAGRVVRIAGALLLLLAVAVALVLAGFVEKSEDCERDFKERMAAVGAALGDIEGPTRARLEPRFGRVRSASGQHYAEKEPGRFEYAQWWFFTDEEPPDGRPLVNVSVRLDWRWRVLRLRPPLEVRDHGAPENPAYLDALGRRLAAAGIRYDIRRDPAAPAGRQRD